VFPGCWAGQVHRVDVARQLPWLHRRFRASLKGTSGAKAKPRTPRLGCSFPGLPVPACPSASASLCLLFPSPGMSPTEAGLVAPVLLPPGLLPLFCCPWRGQSDAAAHSGGLSASGRRGECGLPNLSLQIWGPHQVRGALETLRGAAAIFFLYFYFYFSFPSHWVVTHLKI